MLLEESGDCKKVTVTQCEDDNPNNLTCQIVTAIGQALHERSRVEINVIPNNGLINA